MLAFTCCTGQWEGKCRRHVWIQPWGLPCLQFAGPRANAKLTGPSVHTRLGLLNVVNFSPLAHVRVCYVGGEGELLGVQLP